MYQFRAILRVLASGLALALTIFSSIAAAQEFPNKPVRIVVPYPPGGTTDLLARLYAQKLSELWSQPVTVENKPGASGNIGMDAVARATPDGYTLVMVNNAVAINVTLVPTTGFDLTRDFAPLGLVASTPMILAAYPGGSIKTLADLTAQAKAKPGTISFASCGNGTPQHLATELYMLLQNVSLMHIPYTGCAPAVTALVGGQIQLFATTTSVMGPLVKSGRVIGLAQTAKKRSMVAPDVPTFAEAGVTGYELDIWYGLLTQTAVPKAIQQKISADMLRVSQGKEFKDLLKTNGIDEAIGSPAEMTNVISTDLAKYANLFKKIGLKAQ